VHSLKIDSDDFNLVRMNTSMADGNLSYFDFHYLVGTPDEVQHFVERHEMGLFEREEMETAFKEAGLTVEYHAQGLMGRGLYIGHKE
jgi:hypothetical protein